MEQNENGIAKIESTELSIQSTSYFSSKDQFDHVQRVAKMFSSSDLVPKRYQGNVGNCVIALEMAARIGASPLMVMQNLDVILGKPSWSSKFLIASLNASGKFSPLRYEEDEKDGGRTRAWAFDKANNEKVYGAWVSMEMAKAELWIDKNGSKWKTMPELMRRYRAASFFTNQFAPEISMGLTTIEEAYDIGSIQTNGAVKTDKELERLSSLIEDAKSVEELNVLIPHADTQEKKDLLERRKAELTEPENEIVPQILVTEIKAQDEKIGLDVIYMQNKHLHGNKEFESLINQQKIAIGKVLTGKKQHA